MCKFLKKKRRFINLLFTIYYFTILLFLKYNILCFDRFVNCMIKRFFKTDNRKINGSVILNTHKEVFVLLLLDKPIHLFIFVMSMIIKDFFE